MRFMLALVLLVGCSPLDDVDVDRGYIDETLTYYADWPGVDTPHGPEIPLIQGFGNGGPAAYWFLGFAPRRTADSFWFCEEGVEACPVDAHRRLNWDTLLGHPMFMRIPGQADFSPFWAMWKVTVPRGFAADSVKTEETLRRLEGEGRLRVEPFVVDFGERFGEQVGPQEAILHCALVLRGTTLAENGTTLSDNSGPMKTIERRFGWIRGFRVDFIDFSQSDGLFPEAFDSEARPRMPFANIYIFWRQCDIESSPICDIPSPSPGNRRAVSERGLFEDLTGDRDLNDTNNLIGVTPCNRQRLSEPPYSPLWRVNAVYVQRPGISLMDSYASQRQSDMKSADDIFAGVAAGDLAPPAIQTDDETGNPVPGNDGQLFFNCPSPVPVDYVPFPCADPPPLPP